MGIRYLGFAILVLATSILVLGITASDVDKKGCSFRTRAAILLECAEYIQILGPEIPPSYACCAVMKTADIPCLCKHIPRNIEVIISMKKFVDAAHTCGSEIPPPGGMCGSKLNFYFYIAHTTTTKIIYRFSHQNFYDYFRLYYSSFFSRGTTGSTFTSATGI